MGYTVICFDNYVFRENIIDGYSFLVYEVLYLYTVPQASHGKEVQLDGGHTKCQTPWTRDPGHESLVLFALDNRSKRYLLCVLGQLFTLNTADNKKCCLYRFSF